MDRMPGLPTMEDRKEGGEPPSGDSDADDMVAVHAGALMSAIKRGDRKAVANAFRAMKSACEEDYGSPDDQLG